ncbi:Reverse transcriptase ribonuclease h [Mycena kentingensis (nom. inval.)]|nr:Reverse transcriptase ribonuclease h [Mycena kentingensis (nom. inval.)]
MTTITPPQDQGGSPSAAPPPPLPTRKRKTHANPDLCSFLKQMPLDAVEDANKEIKGRNKDRWLRRYQHQKEKASAEAKGETPPTFTDSDDESLITLPAPPTPSTPKSPKAKALAFLGALSPTSLASSMRLFKRKIDSPEGQPPPKKFARPAPVLLDADAGLTVFDAVLKDMHSFNKYISASLFTNENLIYLNQNALLLQRSKQYVQGSDKQILLLDQANFESLRGREEDLDRADWAESAANQVRWAREMQDDALVSFLEEHYQWLALRPEAKKFHKAVLLTDIAMRKKWTATPFLFDGGRWHKLEYDKHHADVQWDHKQAENASATSLLPATSYIPTTSLLPAANIAPTQPNISAVQPPSKPGRLGALAAQGRSLFQKGTAGGPRQDVCLLCAKRGHKQARCNEKAFADGKPIRARIVNHKLVGLDGKEICRAWNATSCDGSHGDVRQHICAFCFSAAHRAFDWQCQRNPEFLVAPADPAPSHPVFVPPTASLSPEFAEIRTRINCPYDVDEMERLLHLFGLEDQHPGLVESMRNGFSMGSFKPLRGDGGFPESSVAAGRMSGPFSANDVREIVGGHFQCSPMIVAEQTQELGKPNKLRLCRHLSKGDASHPSTNDHIDKDDFPTRFGTAAEVAEIVANAPEGAQGMTLDIAKFHRTCPILPEHKRWFVVQDSRGFYIDHNCPFGCASSSSNAGRIAMAVMAITKARGVDPLNRYEDDFLAIRSPTAVRLDPNSRQLTHVWYGYDRRMVLEASKELKVPWHPDKGQDFDEKVVYIGFEWDLRRKQVVLPENKRLKFLRRVTDFHELPVFSLHEIMKIHGSLCHIAYVYPNGRSYIAPLSNAIVLFNGSKTARHHHTTATDTALKWWRATLSVPGIPRVLVTRGPVQDLRLYVDASTDWGIGTYWDGQWDAFRMKEGWKSKSRHITWLEAIALEFMVYTIEAAGLCDANLKIYSDNQGVIGAFRKGRSPNSEINLAIRRMEVVLDARNIALELEYVPSMENPADKLSRGVRGDERDRMPFRFEIPSDLKPYLYRIV